MCFISQKSIESLIFAPYRSYNVSNFVKNKNVVAMSNLL